MNKTFSSASGDLLFNRYRVYLFLRAIYLSCAALHC